MNAPAVTRVAPSPTGDPHVGTAYVALFSLLTARKTGGRFILRIEDTDRTRFDADSERQIIEALQWLGLEFDEGPGKGGPNGPYHQSERTDIYRAHVQTLLDNGTAYRCFCTPERLNEMRHAMRARKQQGGYDGLCRGLLPEDVEAKLAASVPYVVRMRVPKDRTIEFEDLLRGKIKIEGKTIDDQVLLKSDGYPTYHLANVVDDHLMEVTEVIRAEEWITSTPKHVLLYEAFGWERPRFRHMPLLRNKDKSKISKRKNPTSIMWYRETGYLPHALLNFLALMGYSLPDGNEVLSDKPFDDLLATFDPDRISTTGPVFDLEKLTWLNGEHIRAAAPEVLTDAILEHYRYRRERGLEPREGNAAFREWAAAHGGLESDTVRTFVLETMPLVQERIKTLGEYGSLARCFFVDDVRGYAPEDLVPKKRDMTATQAVLGTVVDRLGSVTAWETTTIEEILRSLVGELEWKPRELFQAVRVAGLGSKVSPPLFESLALVGKDATLARLRSAVD